MVPTPIAPAPSHAMRTTLLDGPAGDLIPATDAAMYGNGVTMDPAVRNRTGPNRLVDWVHVQILDVLDSHSVAFETSAVVEADGDVMSAVEAGERIEAELNDGLYQVVIRHWSHLPVISPPLVPTAGDVSFDFSTSGTGQSQFGAHQKSMGANRFAMYLGNADQTTALEAIDINASDKQPWLLDNGTFGQYLETDFTMDGEVSSIDRLAFVNNNGIYGYPFAPGASVAINEVKADNVRDWVEFHNPTSFDMDLGGFVLTNSVASYTFPAGTLLASDEYLVLDQSTFGFDLAATNDGVQLRQPVGGAVVDEVSWTSSVVSSIGRCRDGIGDFATMGIDTENRRNVFCTDDLLFSELSGLDYQPLVGPAATLWAVEDNGIMRKVNWDTHTKRWTDRWTTRLRNTNGGGNLDTEGITYAGDPNTMYVAIERDKNLSGTTNMVLRYDVSVQPGSNLSATAQWDLTSVIPAPTNKGFEAITWIPDSYLVSNNFTDQSGSPYVPSALGHAGGLFFLGTELSGSGQPGKIYAAALFDDGTFDIVTSFSAGLSSVMALEFDENRGLWAICDNNCAGQFKVLGINNGQFVATSSFPALEGMATMNNEAFAIADSTSCLIGDRQVYFGEDGGGLHKAVIDAC